MDEFPQFTVTFYQHPDGTWMPDIGDDDMPQSLKSHLLIDLRPLTADELAHIEELVARHGAEPSSDGALTWEEAKASRRKDEYESSSKLTPGFYG